MKFKSTLPNSNPVNSFFLRTLMVVLLIIASEIITNAATITSNGSSGNWNSTSIWVGGVVPGSGDMVVLAGKPTITVTADAPCLSLSTSSGSKPVLSVNSGVTLTVTNSISVPGSGISCLLSIQGSGTVVCDSVNICDATTPSASYTFTLSSTISNLNISRNVTLTAASNGGNVNTPVFDIESGIVTIGGSLVTTGGTTGNAYTLEMNLGTASGTLIFTGATPWNLAGSGTNSIILNGTCATVEYTYGGAETIGTSTAGTCVYTDLILGGSGTKTFGAAFTIGSNLSINSGVVADLGPILRAPTC